MDTNPDHPVDRYEPRVSWLPAGVVLQKAASSSWPAALKNSALERAEGQHEIDQERGR